MTLTRHNVREIAFQTLFLLDSKNDVDVDSAERQVLHSRGVQEIPEYLNYLVNGVLENESELDKEITQHLKKGWALSRISRTDVNIMRIGLFEIQHSPAIPDKVAINEALQLADQYSDLESKKFINGILSNFVQDPA